MTIGSELQAAREQHGLTLRDISDRTKIRVPVLRAMENDDFAHAPGGVIMRGFLKLYAREVGLDPDDIARRFAALQASEANPAGAGTGADVALPVPVAVPRFPRPAIVLAIAIAVIGGGYLAWSRLTRSTAATASTSEDTRPALQVPRPSEAPSGRPPADTPAPGANAPTPAPATAPPAPAAEEATADVLRVEVLATAACWLSATADGRQIAYRVLNPGDRVSISARTEAVLRIGMPANVTVSINDTPVKPFARPATPATLRITPENYRSLLAAP
jgi:cytoskeleton protein RodZ